MASNFTLEIFLYLTEKLNDDMKIEIVDIDKQSNSFFVCLLMYLLVYLLIFINITEFNSLKHVSKKLARILQ